MSQLSFLPSATSRNLVRKNRNDVRTGKSGEHLVLAKLTRWGYDAHDAPQDAAYDIIVDLAGRVLRVQVKTRSQPAGSVWHYRAQRGNWRSATGTYEYAESDYDIFAAVANSIERVQFVPNVVRSISFSTQQFLEDSSERRTWEAAVEKIVADLTSPNAKHSAV